MMNLTSTLNKVISHKSRIDNTKKDYDNNLLKIRDLKKDLESLNEQYKNTELGYAYLQKVIDTESEDFIKRIEGLVTFGLQAIFYDRPDYACEIRVRDNKASIHLHHKDDDTGEMISPNIKDGVGGGIRTVIGFILQVFFLIHYKAEPVIFVDEGFSEVSEQYIPYLMEFIDELAEKKDLKILLITHDNRLMPYAIRTYRIVNGKSKLIKDEYGKDKKKEGDKGE